MPALKMNRNVLGLIVALAVGVLSFGGARQYLSEQVRASEARLAAQNRTARIVVVRQAIEAGTPLSLELLSHRDVPARFIPSQALTPADLDAIVGQRVVHAMQPGDPILRHSLEHGAYRPFSADLATGKRAITFPVDEVNSFSGMLVPGDVIDLLYSLDARDRMTVRPLLQQVQVLATGTTTRKQLVLDSEGAQQEIERQFATVTLQVPPDDAQRIILAQGTGTLTAVLRNPHDTDVLANTAVSSDSLLLSPAARRRGPDSAQIEMIIGNAGGPPRYIRVPVAQAPNAPAPQDPVLASTEG